ncbi:hypothetical protein L0F63_000748, partial [Massospora cicadina]
MDRFNLLFTKSFVTSQEAFEYCKHLAHVCGFTVRIRTSKPKTIYVVCSREGRPELRARPTNARIRTSERCCCKWKVVLYQFNKGWEFRHGKAMVHNHPTFYDKDMFPQPVPAYRLPPLNSTLLSSSPAPSQFEFKKVNLPPPPGPCKGHGRSFTPTT